MKLLRPLLFTLFVALFAAGSGCYAGTYPASGYYSGGYYSRPYYTQPTGYYGSGYGYGYGSGYPGYGSGYNSYGSGYGGYYGRPAGGVYVAPTYNTYRPAGGYVTQPAYGGGARGAVQVNARPK